MKKLFIIFCLALNLIIAFSAVKARTVINISPSSSATIDGKIEETEWKNAPSFDLKGGGKVFFKYDGEYLFVGVRGAEKGWSHLYLNEGENKDVSVMHASAALGQTVYKRGENGLFQPSSPFAWDLRDRTITVETGKKMAGYLAKNLWVASNNNMGNPAEIEFQVKPRNIETLYVAVVYASDAKNPQYFPAALKDDTIKENLIFGNTPDDLKFDCGQWAKIALEKRKAK